MKVWQTFSFHNIQIFAVWRIPLSKNVRAVVKAKQVSLCPTKRLLWQCYCRSLIDRCMITISEVSGVHIYLSPHLSSFTTLCIQFLRIITRGVLFEARAMEESSAYSMTLFSKPCLCWALELAGLPYAVLVVFSWRGTPISKTTELVV